MSRRESPHRSRVRNAAERWRLAQEEADQARRALLLTVRNSHTAGVSEYDLAELAGVQRSTIRAWLGK